MNRSSLVVCILIFFMAFVSVQAKAQMEFGVGPVLGLNFGTLSLSPSPQISTGGRTGFMIGAQAELGFSKMFYIVLEPTYCGKGGSVGTTTLAVNELDFPALFKVKFMKGIIRPYAFAGPDLCFVLSSTATTGGQNTDISSQTSSVDFAIDFGGGAEYNITPKIGITLDIRYSIGLSNLNNVAGSTTTIKASGFQMLAGMMFHVL